MTLQNRVLPTGEIVADPGYRGAFMGNRGVLHDECRRLGTARWRHKAWICCLLCFKGRRRVPMTPGRYTELFFLDEPVALAAGHRPCAECRRADYNRFRAAWRVATGTLPTAAEMDADLHRARLQPRDVAKLSDLPDGAFVLHEDAAHLVMDGRLRRFSAHGYGPSIRCTPGTAAMLTPEPNVAVLRAGYRPHVHGSVFEG